MGHKDLKVDGDLKVEGHAEIKHHLEVDGHCDFGQKRVVQQTSLTTPVTINSASGIITMFGAISAEQSTPFTVVNNKVHANSVVLVSFMFALPHPASVCVATVSDGSFTVIVNSTSTAPVIGFLAR